MVIYTIYPNELQTIAFLPELYEFEGSTCLCVFLCVRGHARLHIWSPNGFEEFRQIFTKLTMNDF